jgi:hypothetical protein
LCICVDFIMPFSDSLIHFLENICQNSGTVYFLRCSPQVTHCDDDHVND